MKKAMKKIWIWVMAACMIVSVLPVFGTAAAAAATDTVSESFYETAAQADGDFEDLRPENSSGMLFDLFSAILTSLRSLSVDELLRLPANAMDDVVTYIFAVFKILGVNIESLYQIISSVFFAR